MMPGRRDRECTIMRRQHGLHVQTLALRWFMAPTWLFGSCWLLIIGLLQQLQEGGLPQLGMHPVQLAQCVLQVGQGLHAPSMSGRSAAGIPFCYRLDVPAPRLRSGR